MATTVITGRDLSLTIDSKSFNDQTQSWSLSLDSNIIENDVLSGTVYASVKKTGTLELTMLSDWGITGSLCEALWNAANTAPTTGLNFTATADTGAVFTGKVLPAYPPAGGSAAEVQTTTVTMIVEDGDVTLA